MQEDNLRKHKPSFACSQWILINRRENRKRQTEVKSTTCTCIRRSWQSPGGSEMIPRRSGEEPIVRIRIGTCR